LRVLHGPYQALFVRDDRIAVNAGPRAQAAIRQGGAACEARLIIGVRARAAACWLRPRRLKSDL
jgi:hypothetical protein